MPSGPISADPLARLAEMQRWITPQAETAVQHAIRDAFQPLGKAAEPVRNALHGTWLHQPLHAILTDVPVGSWTAAVLFDTIGALAGSTSMNKAADACVLLGIAGAGGASITGLNDWAEVRAPEPRRIGAVHALLNVAATALFVWSAVERRDQGSRTRARSLALAGFTLVSASAHLGGNLVYEHGIGVQGDQQAG